MQNEIRIALVEDDAEFRRSLVGILNGRAGWRVTAECGSVSEACLVVPRAAPDLLLLDLLLPDGSGIETIGAFKAALPRLLVVVLTVVDDAEEIVRALEAGACGYVIKGGTAPELMSAIEQVLSGGATMSPAVARRLGEWFRERQRRPHWEHFRLTEREWELLRLAARGKQQGEISLELGIAVNTVKNHFRRIYEKLGVGSLTDALVRIRGRGLLDDR